MAQPAGSDGPSVLSCIHVSDDYEQTDNESGAQMNDEVSDDADGGGSPAASGRDSPDSQGSMRGYRPRFRSGSRGPLGAKAIVDSKQALKREIKKVDDFLDALDGSHSDAADAQEWAELHADTERLAKSKEEIHKYLEQTTEQVEVRRNELRRWLAQFTGMADIDAHKMLMIRDRLPAGLGPAVARLITFCYPDDDSIEQMPKRYRDMIGKDMAVIAQQAARPAPSQDVSVIQKELQSALDQLAEAKYEIESMRKRTDISIMEREKAILTKEKLRNSMNDMAKRHENLVIDLGDKIEASSRNTRRYADRCTEMKGELERQQGLLVESVEDARRLEGEACEAQQQVGQKDEKIKQLQHRIGLLVIAEKGSDSAIDGLKKTIKQQTEQNTLDQASNARLIDDMRHQNWLQDNQRRNAITQLQRQVDRLQLENGEIRGLRQERTRLERAVEGLKGDVRALKEKQDNLTAENNVMWEEKRSLCQEKTALEMSAQQTASRLQQVERSHERLQKDEATYIRQIGELKRTVEGSDSKRITAQQDLQTATTSWETRHEELQQEKEGLEQELKDSEEAIRKVQLLLQDETRLKAEILHWKKESEKCQAKLSGAEGDNRSFRNELDISKAEAKALRHDAKMDKTTVADLTRERSEGQQKMRDMEAKLNNTKLELDAQSAAATALRQQVAMNNQEIMRLVSQVAKCGDTEKEKEKLLIQEREEVKRLRELVADTQSLLESERQVTKGLVEKGAELERLIQEQKLEAERARGVAQQSLAKSQQLQQEMLKMEESAKTLREQQAQNAAAIVRLERALHDERIGWEQDHKTLGKKSEALEEELRAREVKLQELGDDISALTRSLSDARSEAHEGVRGLQGFVARVCSAPTDDPARFEGLARQLQVRGALELPPADDQLGPGWTILEPWHDDETPGDSSENVRRGPELLVLDLFRHAIIGQLGGRSCYYTLQQTIQAVSGGVVIHPGIFRETATVFVKAVSESRGEEGFEAGLVFWQLLTALGQKWVDAELETVRHELSEVLSGHGYSSIFRLIAGVEELSESEVCHFFSEHQAVVALPAASSAALVDHQGRSVRFFAKSRWVFNLFGFRIRPIGKQDELVLPNETDRDLLWAEVMVVA
ncbi:hypothetical protein DHEL01_v211185 [Diaporthe helianthi]|uniref:Uncharacterized protein n=1 Tax=Diaporthe helianthi TaxID=158607 RepID=A0A2P5HJJ1_DIAHE|nr:hypothetical protein DHEL01_v211185 [Diaporthe helianthi]